MSSTNLFPFDDLAKPRSLERISKAFAKHKLEPLSVEAVPGTKRTSGVSYREVHIAFSDSQIIKLRIKQSGDIFQVLQNGRPLPITAQNDHPKAVLEIINSLDAKRAAFQKAQARRKTKLPASVATAAPKLLAMLTQRRDDLIVTRDGLRETLAEITAATA